MYAYVINHFGSNIKYFEYEIYTVIMLKSITKYDIVYMYSKNDTPDIFVDYIKKMGVITFGYDDKIIINISKEFSSKYAHFNTMRTCSFIYANLLTKYDKVCLVESDIVLFKGFDNVFKFKTPSISVYSYNEKLLKKNYKNINDVKKFLDICENSSPVNGGVVLLKPNPKIFDKLEEKLEIIMKHNCHYPNEMLFIMLYDNYYNLPINYNFRKYIKIKNIDIYGFHFASSIYKHLDIIKDNYIDSIKNIHEKQSVIHFRDTYYNKYKQVVEKLLKKIEK